MADLDDKMVLRTVYLPFDLDQELKSIAFRDDRSKNDLIRELVKMGMQAAKDKGDKRFRTIERIGGPIAAEKLKARVLAKGGTIKVGKKAGTKTTAAQKTATEGRKAKAA